MARTMPEKPERLRAGTKGRPVGVDRKARVLRGYVVAQLGPFKSDGRGEFDEKSLARIVELYADHKMGLKARFAHPNESSDGLGKFLGRSLGAYLGTAINAAGEEVAAVRADLHFDASAFASPSGNLGDYLLGLAESDPDALSSSLVLRVDREYRLERDGTRKLGADGQPLPPLWRPKKLFASDIVDEGDAVDGLLSVEPKWTNDYLSQGQALLNRLFAGQTRNVVRARCTAFLTKYLDQRFGVKTMAGECGCKKNGQKLGANLGGLLTDLIDGMISDEMPRESIIQSMADEAAITVEEVEAIVAGEGECPVMGTLEAFSRVLETGVGELVMAAEADGCDYSTPSEDPPADPPADPPMDTPPEQQGGGRHVDLLRRKLALKSKL